MNRHILPRLVLILSVFALVACGDDPADLVRRGFADYDRVGVGICRCAPEVSPEMTTEEQCLTDFREDLPTEAQTQCVERAYVGASDADLAAAECQGDVISANADCVGRAACTLEALGSCHSESEAAKRRCPEISEALEDMVETCLDDDD